MILVSPVKTEKAIGKIEYENSITFKVSDDATKGSIAKEFEKLFGVKAAAVRTYITANGKRAVVKLPKGAKADDIATKLKLIT